MGMGTIGVPWDSHRNGNDNDCFGNGSGNKCMKMGIELWEWE